MSRESEKKKLFWLRLWTHFHGGRGKGRIRLPQLTSYSSKEVLSCFLVQSQICIHNKVLFPRSAFTGGLWRVAADACMTGHVFSNSKSLGFVFSSKFLDLIIKKFCLTQQISLLERILRKNKTKLGPQIFFKAITSYISLMRVFFFKSRLDFCDALYTRASQRSRIKDKEELLVLKL